MSDHCLGIERGARLADHKRRDCLAPFVVEDAHPGRTVNASDHLLDLDRVDISRCRGSSCRSLIWVQSAPIRWLVSLTGGLSTEAKQREDDDDSYVNQIYERDGISVGGKECEVEIVYYDDASNVDTSAKLLGKLIDEDKVNLMRAVPIGSGPTLMAGNVAEKRKLPMVAAHAACRRSTWRRSAPCSVGAVNAMSPPPGFTPTPCWCGLGWEIEAYLGRGVARRRRTG